MISRPGGLGRLVASFDSSHRGASRIGAPPLPRIESTMTQSVGAGLPRDYFCASLLIRHHRDHIKLYQPLGLGQPSGKGSELRTVDGSFDSLVDTLHLIL